MNYQDVKRLSVPKLVNGVNQYLKDIKYANTFVIARKNSRYIADIDFVSVTHSRYKASYTSTEMREMINTFMSELSDENLDEFLKLF